MGKVKESWGSRIGLILAMAGNAVGLGNLLRFPIQAVQTGGGAFIIPYLVSFLLMGIPLLWVEWSIGRYGGVRGNHSTPFIMGSMAKQRIWKYVGVFGIFTNIGIISYYTYIESWTFTYTIQSILQHFKGLSPDEVSQVFNHYVDIKGSTADGGFVFNFPIWAIIAFVVTLWLNIYVLSKGLSGGIEKVAKIAMPLLLIFGVFLAVMAFTLGDTGEPGCTTCNANLGFEFLWNPQFDSLTNPKVWLAAAGQIFFTLSVGMGTILCYAAYVKKHEDIALNSMTAGWMNGFVEIVLGASIVIPIAVGYMGLDWVKENAGFMMAFKTMPYLFDKWGPVLSILAGVSWFGLLFIAGITSSLAMGTPWMGFVEDEFNWSRKKGAYTLGLIVLVLALPTILFFEAGVFDEYDYWTGTVALVIFAMAEVVLFGWFFGIDKGWEEINDGAEINIPHFFKPVIKYITPLFILIILISALIKPLNGNVEDWQTALTQFFSTGTWPFATDSIIGQIFHVNQDASWFKNGIPTAVFIKDMSRLLLLLTIVGLGYMVHIAANKRKLNKSKIK
jgi:SNF family Na+-dependent transporter